MVKQVYLGHETTGFQCEFCRQVYATPEAAQRCEKGRICPTDKQKTMIETMTETEIRKQLDKIGKWKCYRKPPKKRNRCPYRICVFDPKWSEKHKILKRLSRHVKHGISDLLLRRE